MCKYKWVLSRFKNEWNIKELPTIAGKISCLLLKRQNGHILKGKKNIHQRAKLVTCRMLM